MPPRRFSLYSSLSFGDTANRESPSEQKFSRGSSLLAARRRPSAGGQDKPIPLRSWVPSLFLSRVRSLKGIISALPQRDPRPACDLSVRSHSTALPGAAHPWESCSGSPEPAKRSASSQLPSQKTHGCPLQAARHPVGPRGLAPRTRQSTRAPLGTRAERGEQGKPSKRQRDFSS